MGYLAAARRGYAASSSDIRPPGSRTEGFDLSPASSSHPRIASNERFLEITGRSCLSRFRVAFAELRRFHRLCLQVVGVDDRAVRSKYREFRGQRGEHAIDERPLRVQARFERDDVQRDDALRVRAVTDLPGGRRIA